MDRCKLDDWTMLSLTDAAPAPVPWSQAFPHEAPAPNDDVLARHAPDGLFRTRFSCTVLKQGERIALIDAGLAPGPCAYFGGLGGGLDLALAAHGVAREAVTLVAFTHFHLDHVGWASLQGDAFFPNARHVAPAAELSHWRLRGAEAALPHHVEAFERRIAPLLEKGRIAALDDGASPPGWPDLRYRAAQGHTPGHAALVLEGRRPLLMAGDCWHSPAQIERPHWCHRADRDRSAAVAARRALADWASASDAIVTAGHFPETHAFGRITALADGAHAFVPLEGGSL